MAFKLNGARHPKEDEKQTSQLSEKRDFSRMYSGTVNGHIGKFSQVAYNIKMWEYKKTVVSANHPLVAIKINARLLTTSSAPFKLFTWS